MLYNILIINRLFFFDITAWHILINDMCDIQKCMQTSEIKVERRELPGQAFIPSRKRLCLDCVLALGEVDLLLVLTDGLLLPLVCR